MVWGCLEPFVVEPPYDRARPGPIAVAPLGSFFLGSVEKDGSGLLGAIRCLQFTPWAPVVVCVELVPVLTEIRQVVDLIVPVPSRLLVVEGRSDVFLSDPQRALLAVSRRQAPSPSDLATYVGMRLRNRAAAAWLRRSLTPGFSEAPTSARRHWRSLGAMTPRDWRAIARLVTLWGATAVPRKAELVANGNGLDPRTLRSWVRKYLGIPFRTAGALVGWEWVLEHVTRSLIDLRRITARPRP